MLAAFTIRLLLTIHTYTFAPLFQITLCCTPSEHEARLNKSLASGVLGKEAISLRETDNPHTHKLADERTNA